MIKTENNSDFYLIISFVLIGMFILDLIFAKGTFIIFFNSLYSSDVYDVFKVVTQFGEFIPFIVLPLIFVRSWQDLIFVIVLVLLLALVSFGLKSLFGQPRPYVYYWHLRAQFNFQFLEEYVNKGAFSSFPSGHTMSAFTIYTYFAFVYLKSTSFKTLFLLVALVVGFSRIYLFQHFFHDVFMGAFCGFFLALNIYIIRSIYTKD